jgi:hypothetical protein
MSETKAVAVLLWLFELARRGPWLKPSIGPLYWGTLIYLCLLVLSVSLLGIQFAIWFVGQVPSLDGESNRLLGDAHAMIFVFLLIIAIAAGLATLAAVWKSAIRLAIWSFAVCIVAGTLFKVALHFENAPMFSRIGATEAVTNLLLPSMGAAAACVALMGIRWGLIGFAITMAASYAALELVLAFFVQSFSDAYFNGWLPWSISSFWSSLAAWFFIAVYLALYAAFLQPYLGDAARYFRNAPGNTAVRRKIRKDAVDTLEKLHTRGNYDRIIVVAHSLGTVVAYDMLRAYYSRICSNFAATSSFAGRFTDLDNGRLNASAAAAEGRDCIRHMADLANSAPPSAASGAPSAWLVTDFVTLGSPLTHAHYLMCDGRTEAEIERDFERRAHEREFPTCPPRMLDGDLRLTFQPPTGPRLFHHGGQFALTRWTNLYFPVSQVFWGDAIGGAVSPVFGDWVKDVAVSTRQTGGVSFFTHTAYWKTDCSEKREAPHLAALRSAINLADT